MKSLHLASIPLSLVLVLLPVSCGKHDDHGHEHAPGEGHVHAPGEAHGQSAPQPSDHGVSTALGSIALGGVQVAVWREGAVEPGKELGVDLAFPAGAALPPAVRAWVGVEAGTGSRKAKLEKETETVLHGHVEVPKPLPEGSALWIEVDTAAGAARSSLSLGK